MWGSTPPTADLWKSIRDKDIPVKAHNFLWKCLHGCYKVSEYWLKIPSYKTRGLYLLCGKIESMSHILTECLCSLFIATIWPLVEHLWSMHGLKWPTLNFGTILGTCHADFCHNGKKLKGDNRLFKTLAIESVHLIWKLHCDWVINKGTLESIPSNDEIHNKWVHTINLQLKFDCLQMDVQCYGSKALKHDLVLQTWQGTLLNEENLPDNWIWKSGVLVGITPWCPLGCGR
ncbi:hypothetical protein M404DRAFT_155503 [Pisolithus tinctorius Marx 270]|uniref:Reverse transcriptase zinc-binding domain-containing protein n=1 Tax=Pisolithus tinctorius Marx 270 TaxID=870435 RepID=A0A0C3NVD0_PISTI|nr:hypothetical protein M404DRAFT_155503 [Pisolithus tinctorius Marx 270]